MEKVIEINFPLKWKNIDRLVFVADATDEMVLIIKPIRNSGEQHPFEKLIGDFKESSVQNTGYRFFSYQDDIYDQVRGERIGSILMEGEFIREYVLTVLNQNT